MIGARDSFEKVRPFALLTHVESVLYLARKSGGNQ